MPKRKSGEFTDSLGSPPKVDLKRLAMSPRSTPITLDLTPEELQLKNLLLDVALHINNEAQEPGTPDSSPARVPVVLRWAGGWVRDKLLGIESNDIDTAISSMTGEAFSLKIRELCSQVQTNEEKVSLAEKYGIEPDDIGSLHKIVANPDKSKHLETTTMKMLGLDVDFVNLRKETYAKDSRNPQMEFGTAEEDAQRRDATVNALFYNLHTGQVEDFTGGLHDLHAKIIRTPMPPFQTFMDDPLRVLRLVRFASRLGFSIAPSAECVMNHQKILQALKLKISRERVGDEMEKMLKGKHPRKSLELIDRLRLYRTVFVSPEPPSARYANLTNWKVVYRCLDHLEKNQTSGSIYDVLVRSDEARYLAWVLAALTPWQTVSEPPPDKKGKRPSPVPKLVAFQSIKAPNKVCSIVGASKENFEAIMALKNAVVRQEHCTLKRDRFGMEIRTWNARGGHWRLQVLSALLVEAQEKLDARDDENEEIDPDFLAGWQRFLDHLQELDVMDAPSLAPLMNGRQLAAALDVEPDKWMTGALNVCMAWQLRHPEATDTSEAIEEVRSKADELGIVLPNSLDAG